MGKTKAQLVEELEKLHTRLAALELSEAARKQAEKALRVSKERYRELFDQISSGVAIYEAVNDGEEFVFQDFNQAGAKIDQVSREEVIGRKVTEVFPGVVDFGLLEVFRRVWKTGQPEHHPVTFYQDEHLMGWRENYVYKLPSGEIVAVYDDITERKRAEEALFESEQRLRVILNSAPITIFATDSQAVFTLHEGKGLQRIGMKPGENVGLSALDLFASLPITEHSGQVITGGDVIHRVLTGEVIRGATELRGVIFDNQFAPLLDSEGRVEGLVGIAIDITERKQAEEALRKSEERYRQIVETAQEGVWQIDAENNTVFVNAKMAEMLGYAVDEIVGAHLFNFMDEEAKAAAEANLKRRQQGIAEQHEFKFQRKDGTAIWTLLNTNAIMNEQGEYLGALAMVADITERKRAEDELRALSARLAEAEIAERRRLARELHDQVGQNLTALSLNLNILEAWLPDDTPELVRFRVDDSLALLEQTTTRVRSVMTDLRPAVLDDYGLVAAIRWCGELAVRRTGMKIVIEGEGITPRLPVNTETTLFWVVQEAVANVTKHAQATQITITIEADNESVRLAVMDNGVGFDPAHITAPGESGGWGLLTMRERVESLGGSFRFESTPGEGARITVEVKR